jgi:hypothetical protein
MLVNTRLQLTSTVYVRSSETLAVRVGPGTASPAMRRHPFFDELDASLAGLIPEEPVEFTGEWMRTERRTYKTSGQTGTGDGPFVDVVDQRWRGTLTGTVPIAGIAFLVTNAELFWVKSSPAAAALPVDVSLHAYAGYSPAQATFTAGLGGAGLPGVPVACGPDLVGSCTLGPRKCTTSKVVELAQVDVTAFAVLLIQRLFLKTGRSRLWRLREELTSSLPPHVREVLTRRRSGSMP